MTMKHGLCIKRRAQAKYIKQQNPKNSIWVQNRLEWGVEKAPQ